MYTCSKEISRNLYIRRSIDYLQRWSRDIAMRKWMHSHLGRYINPYERIYRFTYTKDANISSQNDELVLKSRLIDILMKDPYVAICLCEVGVKSLWEDR